MPLVTKGNGKPPMTLRGQEVCGVRKRFRRRKNPTVFHYSSPLVLVHSLKALNECLCLLVTGL
jgi:hypothetical protein